MHTNQTRANEGNTFISLTTNTHKATKYTKMHKVLLLNFFFVVCVFYLCIVSAFARSFSYIACVVLKGTSPSFTHDSVFAGFGVHYCICEKEV